MDIGAHLRHIADFPKPGIDFIDITTALKDKTVFRSAVDQMAAAVSDHQIDVIVAMEARGFILGAALAYALGVAFVPVRKPHKLPAQTLAVRYKLEYGEGCLEMHRDALQGHPRVLIVDDLLATGGTAKATCQLVEDGGGTLVGLVFLVELKGLGGRVALAPYDVRSVVTLVPRDEVSSSV